MKLKTLQKSSRVASHILTASCLLMGGLSLIVVIIICLSLIPEMGMLEYMNPIEFPVFGEVNFSYTELRGIFYCILAQLVCAFFILLYAQRLFRCIAKGETPFTANTARKIRRIAAGVLVYELIPFYPFQTISTSSVVSGLLLSFVLVCLSLVFDYGCELQTEVDETL